MIRPAERFAVNILRHEPGMPSLRRSSVVSLPLLVALAAVTGIGLGGVIPATLGPATTVAMSPLAGRTDPAAIEPAAGPAAVLEVPRAADRRFYAPVLFDRIPVTMELAPETPETLLAPGDAGRLSVGGAAGAVVQVAEMALGTARLGPVELRLGPATAASSVLGRDLLDRLAVITIEGERLRLTPR